ncbi:hypothetical protein BDV98DRAFT_584642 [Pterulicium gracile]|uniref:Uncharacterized protein n=1 Tax=Pterulicium gracile TaxID=1884261 RepID=A0A5C3Q9M6_9AGAR|nr:hypothetical protein BDV98DRAFT_584642 [Pterula gracilis]
MVHVLRAVPGAYGHQDMFAHTQGASALGERRIHPPWIPACPVTGSRGEAVVFDHLSLEFFLNKGRFLFHVALQQLKNPPFGPEWHVRSVYQTFTQGGRTPDSPKADPTCDRKGCYVVEFGMISCKVVHVPCRTGEETSTSRTSINSGCYWQTWKYLDDRHG